MFPATEKKNISFGHDLSLVYRFSSELREIAGSSSVNKHDDRLAYELNEEPDYESQYMEMADIRTRRNEEERENTDPYEYLLL